MSIPSFVGITALIAIMLSVIFFAGEKGLVDWSPAFILAMAAVVRILFLFRPPELSDDVYRYLWDGLRTLGGHNPYSMAPSKADIHGEIYVSLLEHVNHPDLITIYPPASQIIFAVGALFGHSISGMKALLSITDLATCYILIRLLSLLLNLARWRAVLYAWHPLAVIEIASSGHIDGAGIFFLLLAILLLRRQAARNKASEQAVEKSKFFSKKNMPVFLSGLSFAFASLVKFFPLIFFLGLLLYVKKRSRTSFAVGAASGAAVLIFPFLPEMRNSFITLNTYFQNWEFSGFAFRLLRNLTSSGSIARIVLVFTFIVTAIFFYAEFLRQKYFSVGNATRCRPVGGLPDGMDPDTFLNLLKTFYFITMSFLLLTPTLYPWYVLYLACLLPFVAGPAGIILSWTVFLSYKVLIPYTLLGLWTEGDRTAAMVWVAPVLAFVLATLAKRISKCKSTGVTAPVPGKQPR